MSSAKVIAACRRHWIGFSVTVRQTRMIQAASATINAAAWVSIDDPDGGIAEVAETQLNGDRLIVRRTRLVSPQATLWPDRRHYGFISDRAGDTLGVEADHRRRAVAELAIGDRNDGAGLRHCRSGRLFANAAWLVLTTLAQNLLRWTSQLGLGTSGLVVAKTLGRCLLTLPGRRTRPARRRRLHLPTGWPWATDLTRAITGGEPCRQRPDARRPGP
jgi:hypothetical protein